MEYEADARHVDLITGYLDLVKSKPVVTPGVKNPDSGLEIDKDPDDKVHEPNDIIDLCCALTSGSTPPLKEEVHFHEGADSVYPITPYSEIYGWLPVAKVATARGWKEVSPRALHLTGKASLVLKARIVKRAAMHPQARIDVYR